MTIVAAGTSQTFTASVRGQTFSIATATGALVTITGAGGNHTAGPYPRRRTFGPFEVGDTITVATALGDCIVEFGDASPGAAEPNEQVSVVPATTSAPDTLMVNGNSYPLGVVPILLANLPAATAASGKSYFVTNLGPSGVVLQSNGSRWLAAGGSYILKNAITDSSNSGSTEVVLDYCALPIGVMVDGDIFEIEMARERLGGTSDTDACNIKIGTSTTVPGTITGLGSAAALTTTTISLNLKARLKRVSSTSVKPLSIAGAVGVGGSTSALTTLTGLGNMDVTQTYLQVCSLLTLHAGEVGWLRSFTVRHITGS